MRTLLHRSTFAIGLLLIAGSAVVPVGASTASTLCTGAAAGVTSSQLIYANGTVTAHFTVAGTGNVTLSFVAYDATPGWPLPPQVVFDSQTQAYACGTYDITLDLPPCLYQTDFVYGDVIVHFTNHTYHGDGRFVIGDQAGHVCVSLPTPAPPTLTPPTPTPPTPPTRVPFFPNAVSLVLGVFGAAGTVIVTVLRRR